MLRARSSGAADENLGERARERRAAIEIRLVAPIVILVAAANVPIEMGSPSPSPGKIIQAMKEKCMQGCRETKNWAQT